MPELDTIMAHRRLYPRNGFMAHLVGYVGEVSEQMLNQARWELYNPGDVVGRSGVELEYNAILMGKNGSRQVLVNSKGKEVGRAGREAGSARKAAQADHRYRLADRGGTGFEREERRHCGDGPPHRRNPGHGQPSDLRSQ